MRTLTSSPPVVIVGDDGRGGSWEPADEVLRKVQALGVEGIPG